jgi:hypothetical protein
MPAPYQFIADTTMQRDLGYLAESRHQGHTLKQIELYAYTVMGPGSSRHQDERRIQLENNRKKGMLRRVPPQGRTGVMLGLRNRDLKGRPADPIIVAIPFGIYGDVIARDSIQFRKQLIDEAELFGVAAFSKRVTVLGTPTRAIIMAMKPDVFPFFLTHLADDFAAPQDWDPLSVSQVVEAARRYHSVPPELRVGAVDASAIGVGADSELRERAVREILRTVRDKRFTHEVRRAYAHRCCACDIQLELIEAAHIDPVEDLASVDVVQNGLALCALHHLAYDGGLVVIAANGAISVDENRVKELKRMIRDGGLAGFRKNLRATLRYPEDKEKWPAEKHFRRRAVFLRSR